jgi:molybdate transport repressor ModE-like protein
MKLTSIQLALLVEIERTGSLARAALNLDVSPPAVSQQLARIEKEVGVALVERGARGARLTPLGSRLAQHGEVVTAELERAQSTAEDFLGTHHNRLRIGAPPSISMTLLPEVLATLRYRYPIAQLSVVDVMSDAGPRLVRDDALDVALTAIYVDQPIDDHVAAHHLLSDPILVVLPDDHRLARSATSAPVDLSDLASEDWVSGPPGRPSRVQLENAAAERGFIPQVPFQTESYDVAQALAGAGVAIGLVPKLALSDRLQTKARPLTTPLTREIYIIAPRSIDHIPLAQHFITHLVEVVSSYPERDV